MTLRGGSAPAASMEMAKGTSSPAAASILLCAVRAISGAFVAVAAGGFGGTTAAGFAGVAAGVVTAAGFGGVTAGGVDGREVGAVAAFASFRNENCCFTTFCSATCPVFSGTAGKRMPPNQNRAASSSVGISAKVLRMTVKLELVAK